MYLRHGLNFWWSASATLKNFTLMPDLSHGRVNWEYAHFLRQIPPGPPYYWGQGPLDQQQKECLTEAEIRSVMAVHSWHWTHLPAGKEHGEHCFGPAFDGRHLNRCKRQFDRVGDMHHTDLEHRILSSRLCKPDMRDTIFDGSQGVLLALALML